MTNEATIYSSLEIDSDSLEYKSYPKSFVGDIATLKGPSPGAFLAGYLSNGTLVDLTNLSTPAWAIVKNFSSTNYVELGLVVSGTFYPLLEVPPETAYVTRFSQNLDKALIYARAGAALATNCEISVEAFDA